jgi:DNA mismatch repair protein MutS
MPKIHFTNKNLIMFNDAIQQLNILPNSTDTQRSACEFVCEALRNTNNFKFECLLDVINLAITSMGKRLVKYSICNPSCDPEEIDFRYNCIEEILTLKMEEDVKQYLSPIADIQKLSKRITLNSICPRDLGLLVESFVIIINLRKLISKNTKFNRKYIPTNETIHLISDFIKDTKSIFIFSILAKYINISDIDNSIFINGIYPEIDKLSQQVQNDGTSMEEIGIALANYIDSDLTDKKSGVKKITKIQLKNNKKLGNYLYLTKQKATILKDKIKNIEEIEISDTLIIKTNKLEFDEIAKGSTKIYFRAANVNSKNTNLVREKLKNGVKTQYLDLLKKYSKLYYNAFEQVSKFVSFIDFIYSGAKVAKLYNYCKPKLRYPCENSFINIKGLRHPIGERINTDVPYIPHDICLGDQNNNELSSISLRSTLANPKDSRPPVANRCVKDLPSDTSDANQDINLELPKDNQEKINLDVMLLYGLNAVGKTLLAKSVGLSVILAQMGYYVPASFYEYSIYNHIFMRINNNDNIYKKQSSFTHEITEIDSILERANNYSLVIGDEIVSSTEHVSGVSIVSSVLITLAERHSTCIFATHMHKIAEMERIKKIKNLKVFHLSTKYDEKKDILIFERILKEGSGDPLYGLLVAKYIIKNKEFMKLANEIKNEIIGEEDEILSTKTSKYNSNVFVHCCQVCGKKNTTAKYEGALDVHHLFHQKFCKESGFVPETAIKMNDKSNLVVLCKVCHHNVHNNKLQINGYLDTAIGRILDFQIL